MEWSFSNGGSRWYGNLFSSQMILAVTQTLISIPPESMGLLEFFGMVSIGMTAGSLGLI
jgi:hypothetical protein